jgi:hypothetical protein
MDARCEYIIKCMCEIFGTTQVKTHKACGDDDADDIRSDIVFVKLMNGVIPLRCQTFQLHPWINSVGMYFSNGVEIVIPDATLTNHDQVIRKLHEEMEL